MISCFFLKASHRASGVHSRSFSIWNSLRFPVVCARSSFARPELVSSRVAPRRRPQQRRRPFKPVAAPAEVNALARAAPEKSLVQYPEITHEFRHGTTSLPRFDAGTRNPVSKGSQGFWQGKYGQDRCEHCICAKPSRDWPQAAIPSGSASGRPRKRGPPAAAANASRCPKKIQFKRKSP